MARVTAQNYQSYMKGSNRHIDTHTREMYLGDSPTVQAGYGTYDSKSTAHKVACYMFSLNDSATESTPCKDIPRGFTVAVEENNTVVEYQYKKPMPSGGYTAADLEVKAVTDSVKSIKATSSSTTVTPDNNGIATLNLDAADIKYGTISTVNTALLGLEEKTLYLRQDVGTMAQLSTVADNLVGAINEVNDAIPTSMSAENVTYNSSGSHTVGSIAEAVATETTRAQTAEADRYTKSETYTKEEVHNLITTPNQEYVSVTATALTTAVTDVLPVTGAADTTYRVGNWDGTQYNDSVFSEYAWNGSAYIKLSTKSQIGEVYDISANHADTTYADLATALGTNGANVPSTIRKGGMSIKFVNSNTHKYEQWNLKALSWSTNTSDWALDVDGSNIPVDKIKAETIQSTEQAIIYETDGGTQIGKIDANGADFANLKRGGQQVARMSDLPTKDSSIGENPSTTNVPTTKAVKDYVDANSGGDYPIDTETTASEDEEQIWGNDAETQEYAKIGSYGMKSKAYLDMSGNSVIPTKDTTIGSTPSQTNVPTSKAVADYVEAHGGGGTGDLPISKTNTTSQYEKVIFGNDAGTDTYAEINSQGIKAKKYFDGNGNEIIFKQPYYILDATGNGNFTSVSSAISSAPKLSTILVVAGKYSVKNCTFNKGQHFIGLSNTGECVFYVDDGQYNSAPRTNNGSFENIAFESRHQVTNTSRRAYCVHIDFVTKVQGVPFEVKFKNCIFRSWNADCLGCGGAKDLKVILEDCRCYQYGNDGGTDDAQANPSCFAMHAAANMTSTSEYAGAVYVYIKDCVLITYTKSALRFGGDRYMGSDNIVIPGGGEWELINNTLYSYKDNNGTPYGTNCVTSGSGGNEEPISTFPISGKDWTLTSFNNGNNVQLLNR